MGTGRSFSFIFFLFNFFLHRKYSIKDDEYKKCVSGVLGGVIWMVVVIFSEKKKEG